MLFKRGNKTSEFIKRPSNRVWSAAIFESDAEFVCKLLREFSPNVLETGSKLYFNGQGRASNDEVDGTVTMAWAPASVHDCHVKHALHHADKSALSGNVWNNYAASSYVLHLRQAHRSPAKFVDDSCRGLGRAAACF